MTIFSHRGYGDSIMSFPLNETTVVEVKYRIKQTLLDK